MGGYGLLYNKEDKPVMETELKRIAEKALSDTKLQFTSLAHHITRARAWKNLNKIPNNSSSSVDGQSVPEAKFYPSAENDTRLQQYGESSSPSPANRRSGHWVYPPIQILT